MALRGIRVRATELGGRTMLDGLQDIIFSNNMKSGKKIGVKFTA